MISRTSTLTALLVLVVGASALAGTAAGEPTQQNESALDAQPTDGHYEIRVIPDGPGEVQISIAFYYSPRFPQERQRARNETLEADWFRGEEILEGAMHYRNRSPQEFEIQYVGVHYQEHNDRIVAVVDANWPGFMQDRDREVIGPGFASRLNDGDEFEVQLAFYDWANWSTNYEEAGSSGEGGISFTWTIGEDPEPRLVLNKSDYKSHESDGLGPTPFVLPAIALSLLALAARRRRYRD